MGRKVSASCSSALRNRGVDLDKEEKILSMDIQFRCFFLLLVNYLPFFFVSSKVMRPCPDL